MAMMLVTGFVCRGPLRLNGGMASKIDFVFVFLYLCLVLSLCFLIYFFVLFFNYCDLFSIYASRFYSCVLSSISVTETVSCFPSKADRCNSLLWVLDFHYMGLRWKDKVSPFTSKAELKKKVSGQGSPAPHHHPGEQIPRFLISRSGLWWQWQWQSAVKW